MTTAQRQQITPQLRQWIVEQAQAGHSAESVLKSMLASGWAEDVAVEAMESTLRGHLESQAIAQGLPPAVRVPDAKLDESPLYLDAGDRRVHVLQAMYNPRIVVFGDLLSHQECDELIELAAPRMARSLTVAWNCRPKSTAGSTKAVIAEKGMTSLAGIWLNERPTEK